MVNKINFSNNVQKTLWDNELTGQISDGMWENTRPYDHYRFWCRVESCVDPDNVGVSNAYYEKRNYNFVNKELIEIIGDRMCYMARLSQILDIPLNSSESYASEIIVNCSDMKQLIDWYNNGHPEEYYDKRIKTVPWEAAEQLWEEFNGPDKKTNFNKTMKMMMAELREIKKIIKIDIKGE